MSQTPAVDLSKEQLFDDLKAMEKATMELIDDDTREDEFYQAMERIGELTAVARKKGWLP